MATTTSTPEAILDAVGGAENIIHFTHCATRLRFELKDASGIDKAAVEAIPGVMGAVPQSGDRYQIVIGGAVQSVYDEINSLPAMKSQGGSSGSGQSDADVKAAARAKARGKNAYVDAFFEYLSDSFRPLLPALLGASLIIAGEAICEAFGLIDTHAANDQKPTTLLFVDAMFRAVFYFLPIMVAYNASKKLKIDPWVGTAVMAALLTPEYIFLSDKALQDKGVIDCVHNAAVNSDLCTAHIAGLPMQLNNYGGQVFVPLMMVAILALVYKGLVKIVPTNVQMVFVPFLSFVIMMPVTAFLIGPLGIWIGTGLGTALFWLNSHAPIIFAILIPMVYPFLVPLGLHWPLNALMLANIASAATNHTDFIQGPMGAWNFACFGATAAVLVWSFRDKDDEMRQTATGALFAGLLGGISEPSLYGIHLRFKRIYPFMLVGCAVGGLVQGIGSMLGGIEGVTTTTFVFTSLLTIPVFSPMWLYGIAVTAAFATSFFLIVTFGYRTKEEREWVRSRKQRLDDMTSELEDGSLRPSAALDELDELASQTRTKANRLAREAIDADTSRYATERRRRYDDSDSTKEAAYAGYWYLGGGHGSYNPHSTIRLNPSSPAISAIDSSGSGSGAGGSFSSFTPVSDLVVGYSSASSYTPSSGSGSSGSSFSGGYSGGGFSGSGSSSSF